jgi:two-component system, NarL family, response regulator NreC
VSPHTEIREIYSHRRKIRCALTHDHVLLRQGLRRLLEDESDIEVVSETSNAAECLRKIYELRPDILVADAATFGLSPAEVELCVSRESAVTKIVFLNPTESSAAQDGWRDEDRQSVARQGLDRQDLHRQDLDRQDVVRQSSVRQTSAEELVKMVRRACGRPEESSSKTAQPQPGAELRFPQERILTDREREVLKLLAEGKTVRAAADILGLSSKTVDAHKFNLMRKLDIHNKAELVMWAIQKKVVKVPVNF